MTTIMSKDGLVTIPLNASDAYHMGYAQGYADGRSAAQRWVRCEDAKPKDKQECFVAYKGPLGFIYDSAVFYDDLNNGLGEDIFEYGTSGFVIDGEVGYSLTSMDYWMPIEPPKEVENG